ncbi:MAG: hypothetical protein WCB68_04255 [Pyrinomonadaceae bacterium]
MRKLFVAALIVASAFTIAFAQDPNTTLQQSTEEIARLAKAPSQPGGLGRAVVIVTDTNNNPIKNAYAKLESVWGGDNFCESWGDTNSNGIIALNPIHMGTLKLKVKAKGYRSMEMNVPADALGKPIIVGLARK